MEKEPKDPEKVHHPDDLFFKKVMEKKTSVKAYLENFAPEISQQLDLTTLESSSESFIDKNFKVFQSDIVYRCQLKDSKEKVHLSFLWEHKSSPERHVALQIGLYLFLAMYKMSQEKGRKLEIILPFLFYNGARNWKPKTVHELFGKNPKFEVFKKHIPDFDFLFKNIVQSSELELLGINDAFFKSAMFAMASRNNVDLIIERISLIFAHENELYLLLRYILHFTEKKHTDFKEAIIKSDSPLKNKIMSTIKGIEQIFVKIGKEKGIKIGKEEGIKIGKEEEAAKSEAKLKNMIFKLHKNGFPVKGISEIVDKTEEYVETVILEKGLEELKSKEENKEDDSKNAPIKE